MEIISYVPLTQAQLETLHGFKQVVVRTSLIKPTVVATFRTIQAQEAKITSTKAVLFKAANNCPVLPSVYGKMV